VTSSGLNKGALAGILVGVITAAIAVSVISTIFIMRRRSKHRTVSRRSCKSLYLFTKQKFPFATYKNLALCQIRSALLLYLATTIIYEHLSFSTIGSYNIQYVSTI
jgi:hypothetical protein